MSSDVQSTIHNFLHPQRTAALTAASAAAAAQGQFQAIDDATAIVTAPGSSVLRVRCKPANLLGATDTLSPVTIRVRGATARTITKPTAAAIGTLLSAILDGDGSDLVVVVLPGTGGVVDLSITFDAADATARATLQHRHYAATTPIPVV